MLSQQLQERINALEERINDLEKWKGSTCFPYCTEDIEFSINDNFSRVGEENELQLDDGNNGGSDTGKKHKGRMQGQHDYIEHTTQPPKKKKRGPAWKTHDVEYYSKLTPQRANPCTPVIPANAHAGLRNCDMICYSNAICKLYSCV